MAQDSVKKSVRNRKEKQKDAAGGVPAVVCVANGSNNIELGLLLSLLIVSLYFFGFYETVQSLPDTTKNNIFQPTNWYTHMGHNLNLARDEWTDFLAKNGESTRELDQREAPNGNSNNPQVQQKPQPPPNKPAATAGGNTGNSIQDAADAARDREPRPDGFTPVSIPKHKWPVTIRDEPEDEYDTIIHPGDHETVMKVPKFWSMPFHNYELMTREFAMKVGSCIEPNALGEYNWGDSCPPDKRTIYVAIASYRDFQCRKTVESIFTRAKNPERIRIGIVDQIVGGEDPICNEPIQDCATAPNQALCKYIDQVDLYEMKAELSIGPVFARHIGHRLYRGEYYATQSDAHVSYTQNWDADIIDQLEQTHNELAVLSTYLTDVQGSIDAQGRSTRNTRPIMCNTRYEGGVQGQHLRHMSQPERVPSVHGVSQLQPWWAAGYSFSRGHFVVNVPYDWNSAMIFQGEEMSIGIRGFTIGYDFYAPERSVCFHHYAVGKNAATRNKVKHFWEHADKYPGVGKKAMARLLGIVHMNPETPRDSWDHVDEDIYGLGSVRTPEKFYEVFGIDVVNKKVQNHLCSFVDDAGKMHKLFSPHLRSDGMGIDYSKLDYRFVDPRPNDPVY